ncbi:hypothetical protein [Streptomyces sp. NBC_01304]|uniref:hypothetical protein n=1 Tax=Streptomyces sp. NBC_01304 TaxID=2903818 RepID=UPI002E15EC52|nr:hypothetical protein OG430_49140 [Streptomyces sp. NBC_01304]
MAAEGLARQILALATDLGKLSSAVERLDAETGTLRTRVTSLDPLQVALDELESRTSTLQVDIGAIVPLRSALTSLTGQVAQLRQDLTALASQSEEKVMVWDWATMNQEEAGNAWKTLTDWVRNVLAGRYGWVGHTSGINPSSTKGGQTPLPLIPPCWYLHQEAVEELSWLCQEYERLFTTRYGTPSKVGDWHDRYAPGVRRRLAAALSDCAKKNGHKEAILQPMAVEDDAALSEVIARDLEWRPSAPPPGPVEATS